MQRNVALRTLGVAGLVLMAAVPASVRAAEGSDEGSFQLHVELPATHWMFVNLGTQRAPDGTHGAMGGGVSFGGVSVALAWRRLHLEVGASHIHTSFDRGALDPFVRAGLTHHVVDLRGVEGLGWTVDLQGLVGYRYLKRFGAPDGHQGEEVTEGATGAVALQAARWFSSRGAFITRLLTGVTVPLAQRRSGYWNYPNPYFDRSVDDLRYAVDVALDFGVAF